MSEIMVVCPCCQGHGEETCHKPDHGFISSVGDEVGRLGCPIYGHDEDHRTHSGYGCELCDRHGYVSYEEAKHFCLEMGYDFEPECVYMSSDGIVKDITPNEPDNSEEQFMERIGYNG